MVGRRNTHYGLNDNHQLKSRPRYINCIIFMYHWMVRNHGAKYIVLIFFPILPSMPIVSALSMVGRRNMHYVLNDSHQLKSRPRYINCIIFKYHWIVTNHGAKYIVLIFFPISPLMQLLAP